MSFRLIAQGAANRSRQASSQGLAFSGLSAIPDCFLNPYGSSAIQKNTKFGSVDRILLRILLPKKV